MRPLFPLLLLFFACQHTPEKHELPPDTTNSDSIFIADMNQFMERLHLPNIDYAMCDTAYRFRAAEGWGAFDYLCSVYQMGDSYRAERITILRNYAKEPYSFDQHQRVLTRPEWEYFRQRLQNTGYQDYVYQPKWYCTDETTYHFGAKEKGRALIFNWDECNTLQPQDTLWAVVELFKDVCGQFETAVKGKYCHHNDSLLLQLTDFFIPIQPVEEVVVEIGGIKCASIPHSFNVFQVPGNNPELLNSVFVVRRSSSGNVHRILVNNLKKEPWNTFSQFME